MIKKAAIIAIPIAVLTTLGACVIPRMIYRDLFSDTYPPIWKEGVLYFVTGYIAAFSILVFIFRLKNELCKGNKSSKNSADNKALRGYEAEKSLFQNKLPENADWEQINDFLRNTRIYKALLSDLWRESEAFTVYPVCDTTIACLECLHEDLSGCYQGTFAFDEEGREDRHEEYRFIREQLQLKYGKIDEDLRERIYLQYLQDDR